MKKLLSILLLGSFAIAQAGLTDLLQSGWEQTRSAANYLQTEPTVIGAGIGIGIAGLVWVDGTRFTVPQSLAVGAMVGAGYGATVSLLNLKRAAESGKTLLNKERLRRIALYAMVCMSSPRILGVSNNNTKSAVAFGSLVLLDTIVSNLWNKA